MIKHLSGIVSVLICFYAAAAFAQDTPQSALNDGNIAKASALLENQASASDIEVVVAGLCGQAQIALEQGQLDKALEIIGTLETKKNELKKKSGWNVVILWLKAETARRSDDLKSYKSGLKDVLSAMNSGAKAEDSWEGTVNYLLAVVEENNSDAREYAEVAIDSLRAQKLFYEEGLAHLRLAELEWNRDKQRRAFKSYDNALKAFKKADGSDVQLKIAETQLLIASKLIDANEVKSAKTRLTAAKKDIDAAGNPSVLVTRFDELNLKIAD